MAHTNESVLSLQEVKSLIRDAGLRCTAARVTVVQHLAGVAIPQSHSDVTGALEHFGFDQSTIYRCLTELAEAGILARLELGDSVRRFELRHSSTTAGFSDHPHFMCVDCGSIVCLDDFTFRLSPRKRGMAPPGQIVEVVLKGHCAGCLPDADET
jgi:Fur family ferric uptake transcriptional regulator